MGAQHSVSGGHGRFSVLPVCHTLQASFPACCACCKLSQRPDARLATPAHQTTALCFQIGTGAHPWAEPACLLCEEMIVATIQVCPYLRSVRSTTAWRCWGLLRCCGARRLCRCTSHPCWSLFWQSCSGKCISLSIMSSSCPSVSDSRSIDAPFTMCSWPFLLCRCRFPMPCC